MSIENPELELANKFVLETNRNIFLTGKAGTGKTTFLRNLKIYSPKRMVVVAPTGVAAINAGGVTIHSFFQISFGPIIPEKLTGKKNAVHKFNKNKIKILKSLDLLVIDEISMVRADVLDAIDEVLRSFKDKDLPFGGVQVLMIGDLQQLAPIVKNEEWSILRHYYETMFFFSSVALRESTPVYIELKHIYRQKNKAFIKILNEIRNNNLSQHSINKLNERYIEGYSPKNEDEYITLTTHNNFAHEVNQKQLDDLKVKDNTFKAGTTGEFPEHIYPTDFLLSLKQGAQVMFVKNDSKPEKRFFNGKIGTIISFGDTYIRVKCKDDDKTIDVERETWENIRYSINKDNNEIEEEVIGTFFQYPLRLAWAITIHKSQGLTFDKAIIDTQSAFAHGQTYVALSRCKTLEGIILSRPLSQKAIICDSSVSSFNKEVEENQPEENDLEKSRQLYERTLINELFDYKSTHYYLAVCKKELQNHDYVIQGNLLDIISCLEAGIDMRFIAISNTFKKQVEELQHDSVDDNPVLQERIMKACEYFYSKTKDELLKPLKEATFSCDNASVKKTIRENIGKLNENLLLKIACLELCSGGFNISDYLKEKTRVTIELTDKSVRPQTAGIESEAEHPDLFKTLRQWRLEYSRELEISAFSILSDKMMLSISKALPQTASDLSVIKGLGVKRIQKYGNHILTIVSTYRKENHIKDTMARLL